jgi:hypothetical protein
MGAYVVVLPSPVFDYHSSLGQSRELFSIEAFLSEVRIEALHVSALPRASRLDVESLDPLFGQPVAHTLLDEPQTVFAADIFGRSMPLDQLRHDPPDLAGVNPAIHVNAEAFPCALVQ